MLGASPPVDVARLGEFVKALQYLLQRLPLASAPWIPSLPAS